VEGKVPNLRSQNSNCTGDLIMLFARKRFKNNLLKHSLRRRRGGLQKRGHIPTQHDGRHLPQAAKKEVIQEAVNM
jgi:hypothetical protein